MTAAELEAGKDFGRYKDVDGDGIPWRTLPGTHPTKGAYFTRGTTRDAYARYSEAGPDYIYNVQRLLKKFATAATLVPQPVVRAAAKKTRWACCTSAAPAPAMDEALVALAAAGIHLDAMRLRAFPFPNRVQRVHRRHDHVFVVEQNRDAQMRTLLINELEIDPAWLIKVLHYDGTPITARFITDRPSPSSARAGRCTPPRKEFVMTYIAKPKLHHPTLQANKVGYTRRDYEGRISTLCAGCGHDSIIGRHRAGLLGTRHRAAPRGQALGHRLQQQDARLLPGRQPRLQHRARPHAQRADRRQPGQPRTAVPGRQRRRRLGQHRPGPVRHAMRRGVRMVYIVENNGVYGLTKGQFSRHRRPRQKSKKGVGQPATARSTWSAWRCSWAPPTWRAASRATRRSWCR